jgi:hypothetical protein
MCESAFRFTTARRGVITFVKSVLLVSGGDIPPQFLEKSHGRTDIREIKE